MDTMTVALNLPKDLLGALDIPQEGLAEHLKSLITVGLFREGKISTGKGAAMLGISKFAFVQVLARHGVDYFTESPEELASELKALERLLGEKSL